MQIRLKCSIWKWQELSISIFFSFQNNFFLLWKLPLDAIHYNKDRKAACQDDNRASQVTSKNFFSVPFCAEFLNMTFHSVLVWSWSLKSAHFQGNRHFSSHVGAALMHRVLRTPSIWLGGARRPKAISEAWYARSRRWRCFVGVALVTLITCCVKMQFGGRSISGPHQKSLQSRGVLLHPKKWSWSLPKDWKRNRSFPISKCKDWHSLSGSVYRKRTNLVFESH